MVQIHGFWMGRNLQAKEIASIKSFVDLGYTYNLWSYDNNLKLPHGCVFQNANEIIDKKILELWLSDNDKPIFFCQTFANFFRYNLLYNTGGWWADLDIYLLKKLPEDDYVFTSIHDIDTRQELNELNLPKKGGNIANGFFKVPSRCDLLKDIVENVNIQGEKGIYPKKFGEWGTILFTKKIFSKNLQCYKVPLIGNGYEDRVKIYEEKKFELPKWTYALHWYNFSNPFSKIDRQSYFYDLVLKGYVKIL